MDLIEDARKFFFFLVDHKLLVLAKVVVEAEPSCGSAAAFAEADHSEGAPSSLSAKDVCEAECRSQPLLSSKLVEADPGQAPLENLF